MASTVERVYLSVPAGMGVQQMGRSNQPMSQILPDIGPNGPRAFFPELPLQPKARFVCLGDSITEAQPGYVSLLGAFVTAAYPERQVQFINAGVSGNRVIDLLPRLRRDVVDRKPDWVTIMIGVNDVWHDFLPALQGVPLDEFTRSYRQVITTLREQTGARLLLITPTCIGEDRENPENRRLAAYVQAVKDLGQESGLPVIDMNRRFWDVIAAGRAVNPEFSLTTDGVHPTLVGHMVIATTILAALASLARSGPTA